MYQYLLPANWYFLSIYLLYSILHFDIGAPDRPENLSVQVDGNSLQTSWIYRSIETVNVTFNLSLMFFGQSELKNQTAEETDIQSYNFSFKGVRSCDYFELRISGSNIVGQGEDSRTKGTLPYIPPVDMITKSLSRANKNFTLTVTVMVRQVVFTEVFFVTSLKYYNCICRSQQHVNQMLKTHFISLRSSEIKIGQYNLLLYLLALHLTFK